MQFNNGKIFLFHHYQNKKDRNPRSMQEQSRGCRFTFPPCLYIIPRVETEVLPSRVHTRGYCGMVSAWSSSAYVVVSVRGVIMSPGREGGRRGPG